MEKRLMTFIACLFLSLGMALAQTQVSGTVTSSEDGSPVIGASIKVAGTNTGTVTDIDGNFSLNVAKNATLEITYIGMNKKVLKATQNMKIALDPDNKSLDEVVVVAYGTITKASFTGSAAVMKDKDMSAAKSSLVKSFEGKMAGVNIGASTGDPGSDQKVLIRGIGSINGSTQPLYVVDGVAISNTNASFSQTITNPNLMFGQDGGEQAETLDSELIRSLTNVEGEIKLPFDLTLRSIFGFDYMSNNTREFWVPASGNSAQNYSTYKLPELSNGQANNNASATYCAAMLSWLGSLNYNYDNKYYFSASYRRDGSSRLSADNRWADFFSVSGAWRISGDLKSTYDFIIKQFTDALPLLSKKSDNGYFNYYGALGLRARAYLYNGEYAKALADAQEIINSGAYKLLTRDNYVSAWSKEAADETIFEYVQTEKYNQQRYAPGYYCDASGYAENAFNPDGYLYKYLSANKDKDVRAGLIKDQTSAKASGYYPNKYPGRGGNLYVNNPKLVRLSEIYLIAAEAQWHLDNAGSYDLTKTSAEAAKYINAIDENRIEGYQDKASVTLEDILHEYIIEMFCENQIAFAYWRNHQSITNQSQQEIKYNAYNTIMAIPQREIDYNKDLQQNPEY